MADMKWTDEQEKAINTRGKNVLVSAGAGSGKTTVLVARVMSMLTDPGDPADIGSLLIMTFTRAAAAQMREKIYKGVRKALKNDPLNEHLRRQLVAVHNAPICTIDSLCMDIVRNNFQLCDIDPMFRIADESETTILRSDILKDIIEERYKDPEEDFLSFVNFYTDKSDSRLEEIILTLYDFAQSHPEPEEWIKQSVAPYLKASTFGEHYSADESMWSEKLGIIIENELKTIKDETETALKISNMNYGPYKYTEDFEKTLMFLDSVIGDDKIFDLRGEAIVDFLDNWEKAPTIRKSDEVDEKLKSDAQELRKDIKARLESLKDTYFSKDLTAAYEDMAQCAPVARAIADLTLDFSERFLAAKTARKIADFSDIAHHALKVLIKHDENGHMVRDDAGNPVYTDGADRMAQEIREIIVDEYQDTNLLQEYIIKALSAERFGRPDIFMVGDVKQSIYGFRMAVPALFAKKYDEYALETGPNERILLNRNFRSRKEILDLVNDIFAQTMIKEIGSIDYRDGHALELGADYPKPEEGSSFIPEFVFIDESGTDGKLSEAYTIAKRIEDLVEHGQVSDLESKTFRKVRYSDIAILTRTSDNPEIEQELSNRKIPVIKNSSKGFFDSMEIRLFIDLLKIIDNPFQDIPFTAVITSPLAGVSGSTLAKIKLSYKEEPFSMYSACLAYKESPELNAFMERLEDFRNKNTYLGVCDLIDHCLSRSGLEIMLASMPGGESRRANIELFRDKAAGYSKSSFAGLYNFLRYLDHMRDTDQDFGQAQLAESDADAVQMMTIHKSKGLEFPIVFLARTGKDYNRTDINKSIVLDRELGLGIELRDPVERIVTRTLLMETIRAAKKIDLCAEELRVLYVALTRAKEKLIITGSMGHLDGAASRWGQELYSDRTALTYGSILGSSSFMKTMGRALIRHEEASEFRTAGGCSESVRQPSFLTSHFSAQVSGRIEVEEKRAQESDTAGGVSEKILKLTEAGELSPKALMVKEQLSFRYPYTASASKPVKMTASQLADHSKAEPNDEKIQRWIYKYAEDDGTLTGAEKGTAYHRFFEVMDLSAFRETEDETGAMQIIKDMLEDLEKKGMLAPEQKHSIDPEKAVAFVLSGTGRRMITAETEGKLKREAQFVMGREDSDGDQRLIQGIIDAYFEENGEMVIVDYKTDKNKTDGEFIDTYKEQLYAYRDAVAAATGRKVKEVLIYSVEKGRSIRL